MKKTPRILEEEEKNSNFGPHYTGLIQLSFNIQIHFLTSKKKIITDNVRYSHLLIFLEKNGSRVLLMFFLEIEKFKCKKINIKKN